MAEAYIIDAVRSPVGRRNGPPGREGGLTWPRFPACQYRPVLGGIQVVPPRP